MKNDYSRLLRAIRGIRAFVAVSLLLFCAGCAAQDGKLAEQGRASVIGFTQKDMRMCAGFPTQTLTQGDTEYWSYKSQTAQAGGIAVSTPLTVVPGLSQTSNLTAPSGNCSMQVRFEQGHVAEIAYSGDTDLAGIQHAYCAPVIKNCIGYTPAPAPIVPPETMQSLPAKKP